jgi:DNA-binding GntR family transcriptional regulator
MTSDFLLGRLTEQSGDVERGAQNVNAEAASSEVARYLGLSLADPVLSVTRSFYDGIGRGILHTQGFFRPDRFQLQFYALRAGFSQRRGDS